MKLRISKNQISGQSGQAITEYLIVLAVGLIIAAGFNRNVLSVIRQGYSGLNQVLTKDLETGNGFPSNWKFDTK